MWQMNTNKDTKIAMIQIWIIIMTYTYDHAPT